MNKKVLGSLASALLPLCSASSMATANYTYTRSYLSGGSSRNYIHSNSLSIDELFAKQYADDTSASLNKNLQIQTGRLIKELIIIDEAVPDKHLFFKQQKPGVDIVEINAFSDGLEQLENVLKRYQNLDALHMVSHAKDGELFLGNTQVNQQTLANRLQVLTALDQSLKDGADVLFYGCELAKTQKGEDFLELIANQANVDVAASNDLTGNSLQGGDWDLEIQRGEINSDQPFGDIALKDFSSVLAITDGTGGTIDLGDFPGGVGNYYAVNTYTNVNGSGFNLRISADSAGGQEFGGTQYGYMGFNMYGNAGTKKIYIDFQGGQAFDATSIYIYNGQSASKAFKITSDQGDSYTSSAIADTGNITASLTGFTGITQLTIENNDGSDMLWLRLDNFTIANTQNPNSTPAISIDNAAKAYTEGDPLAQVDNLATLTDADGDADWDGGTLEVQITANNQATDTLTIGDNVVGMINASGLNLFRSATQIGTLSTSEGTVTNGTKLTITFNSNATNTWVQQTLRAIQYVNSSDDPGSSRTVTFTATDKNAASASDTRTITIGEVNDEPTLTATASNPTFTEGGAAASLFSGSSASTVESGQTLSAMTLTVTNVNDGSNERLNTDGTAIVLTHGTSGTTASNSLSYSVSVIGTTATVSLTGGTLSTAATQTMIDNMSYQNNSNAPSTSNRVVTLTSIQDSGGTANGGDNTGSLAIASTVTVVQNNDEPTLTATGSNPTFTEGGAAASLYSGSSASTIESGQTIQALTLTVTNVNDGVSEVLNADGTAIVLTHGTSGTTATNSLSYSVIVIGTTATVSLTGGTMSTATTQTLIDNMSYQNNSNTPNTSNRVVTITSLTDSGGTANGGDDTAALAIASTVTVVGVNDEPTLTATGSNPTFTEGGAAASLYSAASANTIESGQTIAALSLTVTNVNDGADEILNADGTAIALTHGTSGTTATNSLTYNVSVVGTTATVAFSGGTLSTAATQTLVDALSYQNNSGTSTVGNRVVTLTAMQDSGGTANGGDDSAALAIASTVTVVSVNNEPTLTATGSNPTFTEGGAAASLFNSTSISTVEGGQTIMAFSLTVTNVNNGASEVLNADGTAIVLTHGTSGTTATNSLTYNVSVVGTTATVAFSGGTLSTAATQTLIDAITYQNNADAVDTSNRVITITSLQDSGGTANGGDDTAALAVATTVTMVDVNDEPTLTATGSNPTFTEGGAAVSLYSGSNVNTIEAGQTIVALTLTVNGLNDGNNERLNVDGSTITLTNGNSGNTATNNFNYSVAVAGNIASVSLTGGTASVVATQTLINALSYQNIQGSVTTGDRIVTLTAMQDSGGTANGGDDTAALAVTSTVDVSKAVIPPPVNIAPTITQGTSTSVSMSEDGSPVAFSLTLNATDPDNGSNQLSWSIASQASNGTAAASGTGLSKAISYVPNANFNGSDSFVVSVSDGSLSDNITVNVTVQSVNDVPSITGSPSVSVNEGQAYSFTPSATDIDDGDTLTFSIINQPAWAGFDTATGQLSGTPVTTDVGQHANIVISVSDGEDSASLASFSIEVVATVDSDGDGVLDAQELADGTDPNDPDDYLDETPPVLTPPYNIVLDATGLYTTANQAQLLGLPADASETEQQAVIDTLAVDNIDGVACCNVGAPVFLNGILLLPPGEHEVTWQATDNKGNVTEAVQTIHVRPLVSLSKDQIRVEGSQAHIKVILNGQSPFYPLEIPFVIVDSLSTASDNDHDLVNGSVIFDEGEISKNIVINLLEDSVAEGNETLIVKLNDHTSATQDLQNGYGADKYDINSGAKASHTLTIVEGNVAPEVSLTAMQNGQTTIKATPTGGNITIQATATDANPDDTLTLLWSTSDNALVDNDGDVSNDTFVFDPSGLALGHYKVILSVTDASGAVDVAAANLVLVDSLPTLNSNNDSDNDDIDDLTEGTSDDDGDGIPDYLDNIASTNVIPSVVENTSSFLLECDPGILCRLGEFSLLGASGGARLNEDDIDAQDKLTPDPDYNFFGGIFDFEINDLPTAGQQVQVVLPQQVAIPADAVYRKFNNGTWNTFVDDDNNHIHSSAGALGYCPPPGDDAWQAGLIEGYFCVQLTIEDGGPNDADGLANSAVVDPGTVAVEIDEEEPTTPPVVTPPRNTGGGGGGGSLYWPLLLLLAFSRMFKTSRRKKQ